MDDSANLSLQRFVGDAREALGPTTHCSVTMRRGTAVHQVASTDDRAARCDQVEVAERAGPCVLSMDLLSGVLVPDLRTEDRWPRWRDAALAEGFASAAALPAWVDEDTVIAINLYSEQVDPFDADRLLGMDGFLQGIAERIRAAGPGVG